MRGGAESGAARTPVVAASQTDQPAGMGAAAYVAAYVRESSGKQRLDDQHAEHSLRLVVIAVCRAQFHSLECGGHQLEGGRRCEYHPALACSNHALDLRTY